MSATKLGSRIKELWRRFLFTALPKKAGRKSRNLPGILVFLGKYPGQIVASISLLLINIGIEMSLPQILGNAITDLRLLPKRGDGFDPWLDARIFFSLVLIRTGISFILGPIRNRLVQQTLGDIRAATYNAIQRLAFRYHDRSNTGELISRSTTDIWRLQDFFFACLFLSVDIACSLVATIFFIFAISPMLGGITLGTTLPAIALIAFFAARLQPRWRKVHDLHGAMTTVIQENIAGVRVVKAFARESAEIDKLRTRRDAFMGTLQDAFDYWAARVPVAQFFFGLTMPLVLWIGGRAVIEGGLVIGDLAKVVFYLMAIGHRVGLVGQFTNIVQNASASAERVLEVIHEPQVIHSGGKDMPEGRGEVRFEHVSFSYYDEKASLTDVTFEVRPTQTVAIVGPTGSGKTTLVNLIPRFYDAASGRVLIDGSDVKDLKLDQLRRAVSVIFQEAFLFSATVFDNIAYGKPQAGSEEIQAAARAAQADDFIRELEDGYETVIGERGVSLSGGQRQRIAIARAFLMNPRILILDDATASVDAKTERLIQEAMQSLCAGRTTFVIAQRFSTVKHADLILVLKDGRIVERGRHEELIRQEGFYREIFAQQISG